MGRQREPSEVSIADSQISIVNKQSIRDMIDQSEPRSRDSNYAPKRNDDLVFDRRNATFEGNEWSRPLHGDELWVLYFFYKWMSHLVDFVYTKMGHRLESDGWRND